MSFVFRFPHCSGGTLPHPAFSDACRTQENILLSAETDDADIKITDFGLSKLYSSETEMMYTQVHPMPPLPRVICAVRPGDRFAPHYWRYTGYLDFAGYMLA